MQEFHSENSRSNRNNILPQAKDHSVSDKHTDLSHEVLKPIKESQGSINQQETSSETTNWQEAKKWLYQTCRLKNRFWHSANVISEYATCLTPYTSIWSFSYCLDTAFKGGSLTTPLIALASSILVERVFNSFGELASEIDSQNQGENFNTAYYKALPNYTQKQLRSELLRKQQTIARNNFYKLSEYISTNIELNKVYLGFALGAGSILAANLPAWTLGLAALAVIPTLKTNFMYARAVKKIEEDLATNDSKFDYLDWFFVDNEAVIAMKELQQSEFVANEAINCYRAKKSASINLAKRFSLICLPPSLIEDTVFFTGVMVSVLGVLNGNISAGGATIAFYALQDFQSNLSELTKNLSTQKMHRSFVKKIHKIITDHSSDEPQEQPVHVLDWDHRTPDITLSNVSVCYNEVDQEPVFAIKNIDLEIAGGQLIAIVGPSGAGKTTLVDTILGVHQPSSGSVVIDAEHHLESIRHEWRSHVRCLKQDFFLFKSLNFGQILEMGYSPFYPPKKDYLQMAKETGLHNIIEKMNKAYQTTYGNGLAEDAAELSVGQRQLLALTRTVLGNPSVIILDEPSSNLDPILSAELAEFLTKFREHRTGIVITHDMGSVKRLNPDQVIVVNDGSICERGTVDELLKIKDGYFSEMYNLEKNNYLVDEVA